MRDSLEIAYRWGAVQTWVANILSHGVEWLARLGYDELAVTLAAGLPPLDILPPWHRPLRFAASLAEARERLGERRTAEAETAGRAMTRDQLVAYAIDQLAPVTEAQKRS